jgi:hypothetical protein
MRCHCADLIAAARLTVDHVSHGLTAHCTDDLVVNDRRKYIVSFDPSPSRTPIEKRATALKD